jgi:cell wall-associated NlpC family hydrolase
MLSFVQQNAATALQIEKETGIPHELLLAIPGNETGWGAAMAGNNYFGIKGTSKTGANTGQVGTWEVINGQRVNIQDTFRAYGGYEESARDFVDFLRTNPRYQPALDYLQKQPGDWRGFVRMVHEAGYATDPKWSDKIINIGEGIDGTESIDRSQPQTAPKNFRPAQSGRTGVPSVIDVGSTAIGSKYVWGGAGGRSNFDPNFAGSDCSGFVAWAYNQATGLKLPAQTQSLYGSTMGISQSEASPGDLVMYNMGQGAHMEHVGIYMGNGMMLHDSSINPNGGVDVTPLWKGAEFRRVPGVDPSQADYSDRNSPARPRPQADDSVVEWHIVAHGGHQIWMGEMASGTMLTEDMGETSEPTGTLLGSSTGVGQGNDRMGAGQEEPDYSSLDTVLSPEDEERFQKWKARYAPQDSGFDYDLRGAFQEGVTPARNGHFPDTYKKPNHPTFSNESKFAKDYPDLAGSWDGDRYVPPADPDLRRHLGAGQDTGEETFFNPSTGNFEKLQNPAFDLNSGLTPNTALADPNKDAPPVPAAALNALVVKPGESIASGVGDMASNLGTSAAAGTLGTDLASGAGEVTGGLFSGLGSLGRGIADRAGGAASSVLGNIGAAEQAAQEPPKPTPKPPTLMESVNQGVQQQQATATPIEDVPGQASQAVQQIPDRIGDLASQAGDAASNVVGAEINLAQGALNLPGNIARAELGAAQGIGEFAQSEEGQQVGNVISEVAGYTTPGSALQKMVPGMVASDVYLLSNGYDLEALGRKMNEPAPAGSVSARTAETGVESPGDVLGVGGELLQWLNDQRVEAVKQAQAPEIRDTIEGQAMQQGLAMAADPLNLLGAGELLKGREAIEVASKVGTSPEARAVATRAARAAGAFLTDEAGELRVGMGLVGDADAARAAGAAGKGSAEAARAAARGDAEGARDLAAIEGRLMAPDSPVAVARDRAYTMDEEIDLLQSAALDLNDGALEGQARRLMDGLDKHEPQTGDQLHRTIINAVAKTNPDMTAEEIINRADEVLFNAGHTYLTQDAARLAGKDMPDDVFFARQPWWINEAARAAADNANAQVKAAKGVDFGERWSSTTGALHDALAEAAAKGWQVAGTPVGRGAIGAAALGGSELAYGDETDPNHYAKAITKGMFGFGLAMGAPYVATGIGKSVDKLVIQHAQDLLAPAKALSKSAYGAYADWTGNYMLSQHAGARLEEEWRTVFGDLANTQMLSDMEMLGRLPDNVKDLPGAQQAFDHWKAVSEWARKYDIVKDPLGLEGEGQAKMYVPHVLKKEYRTATTRAAEEGHGPSRGRFSRNPFSFYNQHRTYRTIIEGQANGTEYVEDVPKVLGDYYTRAIQSAANQSFVDRLSQEAAVNRPELLGNLMELTDEGGNGSKILQGADVVRARGRDIPEGMIPLNSIEGFQRFGNLDDVHISPELAQVLKNATGSQDSIFGSPIMQGAANINSIFKHNTLSGSAFHLLNEVRQVFATQGASAPVNIGKMLWQTTLPGGYRQWMTTNSDIAQHAIRDGLTLNVVSDRLDHLNLGTRWALAGMNAAVGSVTGYQGALNSGQTNEDALRNALIGGAVGAGLSSPLFKFDSLSPERRSAIEHFSHAMWDRWIPFLKLTTYEMYAPQFGGRAAAEFSNEVYGGQNLLAIARSRNVQNALSLFALAPDWQESWARLGGNALFNWGKDAPVGDMARNYWGNALVQHAVVLEGMNLALGGHFSWQNDPDATLMVDPSRFYDMMGWDHTHNGQKYTPYWDILGPFRGMLEPLQETGRAAAAAGYQASGYDLNKLPLHDEIMGKWGEIPESDPGDAVGRFISSRASIIGASAGEIRAQYDFAGRPIDQAEDSTFQRAINRVWAMTNHMQPSGIAEGIKDVQRQDPWPVAAWSAATGMRTRREDETSKFFEWQDQFVRENKKNTQEWATLRADSRATSQAIDAKIEALQSGAVKNDDGTDMTPRDRSNKIAALAATRPTQRSDLQGLIDRRGLPDGPEKDKLQAQLKDLLSHDIVAGGNDPVDLNGRPDLSMDEVFRLAWNRYPNEIERLNGAPEKPIDLGPNMGASFAESGLGERLRDMIQHEPGSSDSKTLQSLRAKWTEDTAKTWGVDQAVLQDYLKARLYDLPNQTPPALPGVTSAQLDDITQQWSDKGLLQNNQKITDPATAARLRQEYVMSQAQALGVDPEALSQRIKLRNLPLAETSPAGLSRSRALDVLSSSKYYSYQNPDGTPFTDTATGQPTSPDDWQKFDQQLEIARNRFEFREEDGKGFYFKNGKLDEDLTKKFEARQRATAFRYRSVYNSPNREDYYRWFGDGANLTDKQWDQYKAGTLDMWHDDPDPREARNRVNAMRVWSSLTPEERWTYGIPEYGGGRAITWRGIGDTGSLQDKSTSLANYISYIGIYKDKKYKLGDIDPDPQQAVSSEGGPNGQG